MPIKARVEQELKTMCREGIIELISALLVVSKTQGGVRFYIDPKPLNKALRRDQYLMPIIDDVLPMLVKACVFLTVDTKNAFWHVELDEPNSRLTTFETPFGKYRYLRLPYWISSAPEFFRCKMHEAHEGLNCVAYITDDILIYGCDDTAEQAQ